MKGTLITLISCRSGQPVKGQQGRGSCPERDFRRMAQSSVCE